MDWINEVRQEIRDLDLSTAALRKFGVTVGPVLLIFAFIAFRKWPGSSAYFIIGGAGLLLLLLGAMVPNILRGAYLVWMGVSFAIGGVVSRVIIFLIFALIVIPIGLLARLVGKRFLATEFQRELPTYWVRKIPKNSNYEQIY